MVREELIRRKLTHLSSYLDELNAYASVDPADYALAGGPRRAVERLIQLVVETAVDINVHVVTEIEGSPSPDYRASFPAAARCGAIPFDLAERLAPAAGLRNVLVHDYADIDDVRVRAAIPVTLDGFREYASAVLHWLEQRSG